jgi:hypothetical protein
MLKITSRIQMIICFFLTIGIVASCNKDDDDTGSDLVELNSFGPTGARHGDTIKFIGNNLNRVSAIQFTGGTAAVVDQKDFKEHNSGLIRLLVPQAAEKGYVTLKTPEGDIVTKTQFNISVTTTVTSVTSPARPGANITINGNYLNWVDKITFNKDKVVQTFVSKSMSQLVVTVPADAQTGPLILHYTGTDSSEVQTNDTLKVILPAISSFSPNPVKHQTNVTITGTDLDLTNKVWFTGVSTAVTSFVSQTATQLVVNVPASTQKGKVKLEAASGVQTTSSGDLDVVLPAATGLSPNPVDPGADLTVTGTNLDLVTSITFENAPAVQASSFISQSSTQIVVNVPLGVLKGKIKMGVLNSTLVVLSNDVLDITGSIPPPTVALPIYNDAVTSNWNGWIGGGWGGTKDLNNASPVREGTKSVKIDYVGGWGSPFQLGGANINLSSYTTLKLSVYGGTGSGGKKISVSINGQNSVRYEIIVVAGTWTDYAIPISALTSGSTLSEIWIQEFNGSGGFAVYVDVLGLN